MDKNVAGVSEEALAVLLEFNYPGNIRELENIIEHAFVLCEGGLIGLAHLPASLRPPVPATQKEGGLTLKALETMYITDTIRRHKGNRTAAAKELGINPSTLYRKIKALKIALPERDGRSGLP